MITRAQLAAACRAHDNAADTGETFGEIVNKRGLKSADVVHVAQQRALRMVLLTSGRTLPTAGGPVALSDADNKLVDLLATAWLDGLVVGLKVLEVA